MDNRGKVLFNNFYESQDRRGVVDDNTLPLQVNIANCKFVQHTDRTHGIMAHETYIMQTLHFPPSLAGYLVC